MQRFGASLLASKSIFTQLLKYPRNFPTCLQTPVTFVQVAHESSSSSSVDFDFVRQVKDSPYYFFIDVRNRAEIEESGIIGKAVNIPLLQIHSAFSMDEKQFYQKYHVRKPHKTMNLVFYCQSGKRSDSAMMAAKKAGYERCFTYTGGYHEWYKKTTGLPGP